MPLKMLFIIVSGLLALTLLLYKLFISKLERTPKISVYVSFMTGIMLCYILCALFLILFVSGIFNKFVILLFAISPFIIGKFATYKKEELYCYIQIFTVLSGIFYVYFV